MVALLHNGRTAGDVTGEPDLGPRPKDLGSSRQVHVDHLGRHQHQARALLRFLQSQYAAAVFQDPHSQNAPTTYAPITRPDVRHPVHFGLHCWGRSAYPAPLVGPGTAGTSPMYASAPRRVELAGTGEPDPASAGGTRPAHCSRLLRVEDPIVRRGNRFRVGCLAARVGRPDFADLTRTELRGSAQLTAGTPWDHASSR